MKVKLVGLKDPERVIGEIKRAWPPLVPEPEFEVAKHVECDPRDRFLVVSESPPKIDGDCVYLWSKPDPRTVALRALELAFATTEKTLTRRSFVSGREYEVLAKRPKVNDSCLARLGCTQCLSSCPTSALKLEGKRVVIDSEKCTSCGLCSASCPVGAIEAPLLNWNAVTGIYTSLNGGKLRVSCDPNVGDLVVPCIGYLGAEEISVLSSKFDLELVCPNEKCVNRKAAEHAILLQRAIRAEAKTKVAVIGVKRNDYVRAVNGLKLAGQTDVDVHAFRIEVNDNCTLCGVCARKCPTGALKLTSSEKVMKLEVEPHRCVGCNHCVEVCKEQAIRVEKVYDFGYLKEDYSYTALEDEIAFCRSCGRPIDSKRLILKVARVLGKDPEELMYCNECKQKMTAEKILKGWVEKFGEVKRRK